MNESRKGRVDEFAEAAFQKLVKRHANPQVQFACKVFGDEITECFQEWFGPWTPAHDVWRRIIRAIEGGNK